LQGWPNKLAEQSSSSPRVGDIDGDTDYEVVIGAEYMYAWHHDGVEVRDGDSHPVSWGIFSTGGDNFTASPVLVDLDGEPGAEIVAAAWNTEEIYVFDSEGGNFTPNWPKQTEHLCWASPLAADFDGDGDREIAAYDLGGVVYVWHGDGTELMDGDSNPSTDGIFFRAGSISDGWHNSTPAFADIDQDGIVELIACANRDSIYCLNSDGSHVSGWPVSLVDLNAKVPASPVAGDIDGDGEMEVIVVNDKNRIIALNHDGTEMSGSWPLFIDTGDDFIASPALADLTGDGKLEIVMPDRDGNCWIYRYDGSVLPGWPQNFNNGSAGMTESSPVIADINNDQSLDIILGCENGWLNAWDISGNLILGFPIKLKGYIRGTPVVKDLDKDGDVELIAACWDYNVYVWDLDAEGYYNYDPWPSFHGNRHNNGWYHYSGVTAAEDMMFSYRLLDGPVVATRWLVSSVERRWNLLRKEEGGEYRVLASDLSADQSSLILYQDSSAEEGQTYYYMLQARSEKEILLETEGISIPVTMARLYQNYPNPFNPATRIDFNVPGSNAARANVLLAVYDVRGAMVKVLMNRSVAGGRHTVQWQGNNSRGSRVASGVYFVRLQVGGFSDTRKMILLR
ncbi:MAG: T9SS type A sorting domain-containing protein, partial [Candidatus Latescibacteria bacterium]|nr:T9SS type A sorting domain-containing protein [bacterium]MBD3423589.1 T9SS type A sorting domain-containing protein [Candidatus Latescibacterota bacterium]